LNDEEIPKILKAASERGAKSAGMVMLRLPYAVKELFVDWINKNYPDKASKVLNRIRDVRDGKLNESEFGKRFSGQGEIVDAIHQLFDASCRKYHLNENRTRLTTKLFSRTGQTQTELFN
jgi:DNA repair photolyase